MPSRLSHKLSATLFVALILAGLAASLLPLNVFLFSLCFIFVAGTATFSALTHRLASLRESLQSFERSNFRQTISFDAPAAGDEIAELGAIYKAMAERLLSQARDLRDGDKMRRDLIANVSHDLRTPLAALRGYVETLLVKNGSLSAEERRTYLEIAVRQSEHLAVLVSELFELAKLEYEDFKLSREPILLSELARDVIQKFELTANNKQVRLDLETPEKMPLVEVDVSLMERALENLIGNAVKFSPSGGSVRVAITPGAEYIGVEVADSGAGISETDLPHVFDRFYRVDKTKAGAGLGLAITRRIVELHGSEISVDSGRGKGTCFSFAVAVR